MLRSLLCNQKTRKMFPPIYKPFLSLVPKRRQLILAGRNLLGRDWGCSGNPGSSVVYPATHLPAALHACQPESQDWHADPWLPRVAFTAVPGGGRGCWSACLCVQSARCGWRQRGPRVWTWACRPHLHVAALSDRCTWTPHQLPICYETMVTIAHLQGAVLPRSSVSDMKEIISGARKGSPITENISAFMHWSLPWSNSSDMVFFSLLLHVCN